MKNPRILKPLAIALILALGPLPISTAQAAEPPKSFAYKIGDTGPGGGFIFFVDTLDQYPNFTYLEAAPTEISTPIAWCNDTSTSIPAGKGWAAHKVGKGRANTTVMRGECVSGGATAADNYIAPDGNTTVDWYYPSLGEAMLMYQNLGRAGVAGFAKNDIWSGTEDASSDAWTQIYHSGYKKFYNKHPELRVRAIRAF